MKNLDKLTKKIDKALQRKYGEFGHILVDNDGKEKIRIVFEENDYLYEAFNVYDVTLTDELDAFFNNILPNNLYYELENSCVAHIYL